MDKHHGRAGTAGRDRRPGELPHAPQPVALSEPEFAEAVRQALKEFRRPDLLATTRCCAPAACATAATPSQRLRNCKRCCGRRRDPDRHSKTQKLHRVLWHTYFEPAPTQEAAAELLDLPFSTYRYQLGKAVEQIIGWLWQQELYGEE
jgi:hypothetical protein